MHICTVLVHGHYVMGATALQAPFTEQQYQFVCPICHVTEFSIQPGRSVILHDAADGGLEPNSHTLILVLFGVVDDV